MKIRIRTLYAAMFALFIGWSGFPAFAATPVDLLVENGLVVTMNAGRTVIEEGIVAIRKGVIVAVGPSTEMSGKYIASQTIHARGKLVIPGLVNTHTHAAMTIFRGLADDLPLDTWTESF